MFRRVDTIASRKYLHVFPTETELSRVSRVRADRVEPRVSRRARGVYDKLITRLISIIQWAAANNADLPTD